MPVTVRMLHRLTVETGYADAVKVGRDLVSHGSHAGQWAFLLGTLSPGKGPWEASPSRTALCRPAAVLGTVLRDPSLTPV